MKYRKKPVVIEATRWFTNGDHPDDQCLKNPETLQPVSEGNVVRYFCRPDVSGESKCISSIPCEFSMRFHGWIDTPEGGHTVCPGDWIITGIKGEHYPCKNDVFLMTYEPVDQDTRSK